MRESGRARPAGRAAARDLFEQVRLSYFRLSAPLRRLIYAGVLIGAVVAAGVRCGLGLAYTFVTTLTLLGFVALTLRFPRAAATLVVVLGWLAVLTLLQGAYGWHSPVPTPLMILGLARRRDAHLIRWVPPWVTTLLALVSAGAVAAVLATTVAPESPGVAVGVAYGVAAAVLVYRFVQARQARIALAGEEQQVRLRGRDGRHGAPVPRPASRPRRRRSRWRRRSASWRA